MKVICFLIGCLLLPLAAALTRTVWFLLSDMDATDGYLIPRPTLALLTGFLTWLAAYWFLPRPVLTYVLAHELTHALWGAIMGASVLRIRVGHKGGSVSLSKSNAMITLAPYFFPLYAVIVILTYYVLSLFFDLRPYTLVWLALTGCAWGFHVTFTLQCLWEGQSDIRIYGRLFSYTVIYLFNLLGLALWAVLVSDLTLDTFIQRLAADLTAVGVWCRSSVADILRRGAEHWATP